MTRLYRTEIYAAVRQRGAFDGLTEVQNTARHVVKMLEEVGELAEAFTLPHAPIPVHPANWHKLGDIMGYTGALARLALAEDEWDGCGIVDYDGARTELVDIYIVLACLAVALERMTGEPFDVEMEALAKARRDITRSLQCLDHVHRP